MKKYVILFISIILSASAQASNVPTELGEYGDWTAYSYKEGKNLVCYMASTPKKDEGNYKKGSNVVVKIGTTAFNNLFTNGDNAWAPDTSTDKKLVEAMKRGQRMIVEGTSSRGTKTKDTYSLAGFSNAYKAISAKCK